MLRGLIASVVVGVICAVVGCYVVLRTMAFMGDAVAHAILPGVAIAYLLRADLLIGALIAAIAVAFLIGALSSQGQFKEDTAIGIVFAAALALGVALMSTIATYSTDLTHVLFGNVLGVSEHDLWLTASLAVVVLAVIVLFYKEFLIVSFDPVLATTQRLPIRFIRNTLLVLLALTVVISLQTVGIGLVAAMLVTPAATAYLITRRLGSMMVTSAMIGALSAIGGLFVSFYVNISSGASIVLFCTLCFLITYLFVPNKGLVSSLLRRSNSRAQTIKE